VRSIVIALILLGWSLANPLPALALLAGPRTVTVTL